MAQQVLQSLPSELQKNGAVRLATANSPAVSAARRFDPSSAQSQETPPIDWQKRLSRGELLPGGILELSSDGGVALGTSIALRACQRIQREAHAACGITPWCAFVDPTSSLYAPGVHAAGVDLRRLLVVRPDEESIVRVTLRLVESKMFPLVIVDLMGLPSDSLNFSLGAWVRVVRRLSLALAPTSHTAILLTDRNAPRPLPLPVSERLLLSRSSIRELTVTVSKCASDNLRNGARIRWTRVEPFAHAS